MKTKLIVKRFGETFEILRFIENSYFNSILGFTPYWDYKHSLRSHSGDSPAVYTSEKILNLRRINNIHLKWDVIDSSVVIALRHPLLFSFVLDKPFGYKVICQPETVYYIKLNKPVLNTLTFF